MVRKQIESRVFSTWATPNPLQAHSYWVQMLYGWLI